MRYSLRLSMCLVCLLYAQICSAAGINTFIGLSQSRSENIKYFDKAYENRSKPLFYYKKSAEFMPKRTTAGMVLDKVRAFFGAGNDGNAVPDYVRLMAHDPVSGGDISRFGASYSASGPMGSGIAPHGN